MENLNAEQVKKALECCASPKYLCEECPIDQKKKDDCVCGQFLAENALALINSQEQRIKELDEKVENYRNELGKVRFALAEANNDRKELTEENERLHASCTELTRCCTKLETLYKIECKRVDTVKADTVRKMQTLIEEKADSCDIYLINSNKPIDIMYQISKKQLDQIAKEMLEGEK